MVLANGQLPAVRDITDPVWMGVHRAAALANGVTSEAGAKPGAPAYVPRDFDAELRECLAAGGFVLMVGDSTAGKTRAAFEAARSTLARPRSPAVIGWSQLNAVRGDLVVDGAGVAGDGGRVCVDLVEEQFQGAGDAP